MVTQTRPVVETLCRSCGTVFEPHEMDRFANTCRNCDTLKLEIQKVLGDFRPRQLVSLARPLYYRAIALVTNERFIEASGVVNQLYLVVIAGQLEYQQRQEAKRAKKANEPTRKNALRLRDQEIRRQMRGK